MKVEGYRRHRQKEGRTLNGEMMMLSVSDVNRGGYIVNRHSRLAVRAGPASAALALTNGTFSEDLIRGKWAFVRSPARSAARAGEMIACRSSSPRRSH